MEHVRAKAEQMGCSIECYQMGCGQHGARAVGAVVSGIAKGAWAQGSSEIQLASGCLMKAAIQMKTNSLGMLLSYATMCQCRKAAS